MKRMESAHGEETRRLTERCRMLANRLAAELRTTTASNSSSSSLPPSFGLSTHHQGESGKGYDTGDPVGFLVWTQQQERQFAMEVLAEVLRDIGMGAALESALASEGMNILQGTGAAPNGGNSVLSGGLIYHLVSLISLGMSTQAAQWTSVMAEWCEGVEEATRGVEEVAEVLHSGPLPSLFQLMSSSTARVDEQQHRRPTTATSTSAAASPGTTRTGLSGWRSRVSHHSGTTTPSKEVPAADSPSPAMDRRPVLSRLLDDSLRLYPHSGSGGGPATTSPQTPLSYTATRAETAAPPTAPAPIPLSSSLVSEAAAAALSWTCDVLKACLRGLRSVAAHLRHLQATIEQHPPPLLQPDGADTLPPSAAAAASSASSPSSLLNRRLAEEVRRVKLRSIELQERLLQRIGREHDAQFSRTAAVERRVAALQRENRDLLTRQLETAETPGPQGERRPPAPPLQSKGGTVSASTTPTRYVSDGAVLTSSSPSSSPLSAAGLQITPERVPAPHHRRRHHDDAAAERIATAPGRRERASREKGDERHGTPPAPPHIRPQDGYDEADSYSSLAYSTSESDTDMPQSGRATPGRRGRGSQRQQAALSFTSSSSSSSTSGAASASPWEDKKKEMRRHEKRANRSAGREKGPLYSEDQWTQPYRGDGRPPVRHHHRQQQQQHTSLSSRSWSGGAGAAAAAGGQSRRRTASHGSFLLLSPSPSDF